MYVGSSSPSRILMRNLLKEFVHFLTHLGQDLTVLCVSLKLW